MSYYMTYYTAEQLVQSHDLPGALGELSSEPTSSLIEIVHVAGHETPLSLVTRGSFVTLQDTSTRYSQRIATVAWYGLEICIPGATARAQVVYNTRNTNALNLIPDLTSYAIRDAKKNTTRGYPPENFIEAISIIERRQKLIPGLGVTAVSFLKDLSQAVQDELIHTTGTYTA
jgi:hypothetical protein